MAQPQQQQQQFSMSQRQFSPQDVSSPGAQQSYPFPAQKRQRLSPNPSQPTSPAYTQSPYAMSPGPSAPPSATASPHFPTVALPQSVYNTPYSNGNTTPTLSLPTTPQPQHQLQHQPQNPLNYIPQAHNMGQAYQNYPMPQQGAGMMGPPSKPPEKKENESDAMDILNGTGIDLKEEEQYMITHSFNHEITKSHAGYASASHSYSQFAPGDAASFYGAGPANAAAESADGKSQEEYLQLAADRAWHDAARRLANSREREIYDPFLMTQLLQRKVDKAAREQGLSIRAGGWVLPENFHNSTVDVRTAVGSNGALVQTNGAFLNQDAQLADQVALLSLATKQRLRGFIEDAAALAKGRQTGSHGIVPEEWKDVATPINLADTTIVPENGTRVGWESAVEPPVSRKRSVSGAAKIPTPVSDAPKKTSEGVKMANDVVVALRAIATKERDFEEARLRKRQARAAGGDAASRQGSIVPGTPGSVAPESSEKAPTKKEQTKKAQAKVNEAANHAAANQTTNQFLGGGGSLWGKKKKYSWMNGGAGGGGGGGASTPSRVMAQGGGHSIAAPPVPAKLTSDGVRRVGAWREDHDKGKGIQLRDWIAVLEDDGREKRALQLAYMNLDDSGPK